MKNTPLAALTTEQVQSVITLAKAVQSEYQAAGKVGWSIDDCIDHPTSENEIAVSELVQGFSNKQRAELVALMSIGGGVESFSGSNWGEILRRAEPNSLFANYLTDKLPLGENLEKGLQAVSAG